MLFTQRYLIGQFVVTKEQCHSRRKLALASEVKGTQFRGQARQYSEDMYPRWSSPRTLTGLMLVRVNEVRLTTCSLARTFGQKRDLIRKQRSVLLGRVQAEVDVAEILVGAIVADAFDE